MRAIVRPSARGNVAFIAEAAGQDFVALDALNLEPAFDEVAASLVLGVLPHRASPGERPKGGSGSGSSPKRPGERARDRRTARERECVALLGERDEYRPEAKACEVDAARKSCAGGRSLTAPRRARDARRATWRRAGAKVDPDRRWLGRRLRWSPCGRVGGRSERHGRSVSSHRM